MEEKLAASIDSLPMLPTVLVKLFSMSPEQDDYFENIVGLAEGDPGLSVKILHSSNSAASAPVKKIESIPTAVLRLGAKRTVSLITSLMMAKVFNPKDGSEMDLWVHSLQVAAGSRLIAAKAKLPGIDPEAAYLAGQLHEVGRLVMHGLDEDYFLNFNESSFPDTALLLQAEMEAFEGLNHAELGFRVCEHWQLPELIANTVRHHYQAGNNDFEGSGEGSYLAVVALANQISQKLLANQAYLDADPDMVAGVFDSPALQSCCSLLNLQAEQLHGLVEEIDADANRIASTAGISY